MNIYTLSRRPLKEDPSCALLMAHEVLGHLDSLTISILDLVKGVTGTNQSDHKHLRVWIGLLSRKAFECSQNNNVVVSW